MALPDSLRVEAAIVNEGAVFDKVREDGAHRAFIAGVLYCRTVAKGLSVDCFWSHLAWLLYTLKLSTTNMKQYSRVSLVPNSPRAMLEARSSCRPNELDGIHDSK